MPNAYNFVYDFEIMLLITPIPYVIGFPNLYMHMFRQRARFYSPPVAEAKKTK